VARDYIREKQLTWIKSVWVDNIKLDRGKIRRGGVDWIGLAEDRYKWRAFAKAVMNLRVS
jgi:hypothetical protein